MPCVLAEHALTSASILASPSSIAQPASLSRDLPQKAVTPPLMHTLRSETSSVLSITADENYIFSGSQGYDISVWDRQTLAMKTTLRGHTGSVLALELAGDKGWLISSSGDSTVRLWCTTNLTPMYILNPYLESDSGDIYCLSYSPSLQTVYFGCQNTSLQWFNLNSISTEQSACQCSDGLDALNDPLILRESDIRPGSKRNKFFGDGIASGQATPTPLCKEGVPKPKAVFQVRASNVNDSAHYGYIYSMALLPSPLESNVGKEDKDMEQVLLVTGSGDETVKIWRCISSGPELVHTFEASAGAVLSLVVRHETVFAGCQDGHVKVFDLGTKTLVRTIIAQEGVDILSLSLIDTDLYTCSANGQVQRWSASFDCTASWHAHDGIVLSSLITHSVKSDSWRLVTGANDNCIKVLFAVHIVNNQSRRLIREKLWHIERPKARQDLSLARQNGSLGRVGWLSMQDTMLYALSTFISIPSVSSEPKHREDCRQAAIWLKKCLTQLGADSSLLPTEAGRNPLVFATFYGSQSKQDRPRILFYGHYDVMPAPTDGWNTDPFSLTGRDGYNYGRGATDNKGPILAVACAASELLSQRALECDLVFLIEGEEEAGSVGFKEAVERNKELIGRVDAILVSNSTWISEDRPCITYGMRGVVHCSIEISSDLPDLHSGVDGGAVSEPMFDMVRLLASLSQGQHVLIPGFYDNVKPKTDKEFELYKLLSTVTGQPSSTFSAKWREPSLSIHNLEVSGPGNPTVIPAKVNAKVSLRIVPNQNLDTVINSLREHLQSSFEALNSPNKIQITVDNATDWWLGDVESVWFKALEAAIKDEWGTTPLRIREGGSIPSVPYLEKEFKSQALHLPLGQSTDRAHLNNERISLNNLRRGKSVIERFLKAIST